jgi:hypothetical protein
MPLKQRVLLAVALAAAAACGDLGNPNFAYLTMYPLLDSLFVGDSAGARALVYVNDKGNPATPTGVRWSSTQPGVVRVDSLTGKLAAVSPGSAVIVASLGVVQAGALIVVSKTLDLHVLLDTIYLMPGDTFTVPVAVLKQGGGAPLPRFGPSPNAAVYTMDTVTGLMTAVSAGGPLPYVARADSLADTGQIEVLDPADTTSGKSFFAVHGSVISGVNGGARALNYYRRGDTLTFRLRTFVNGSNGITATAVVLLLRTPITEADTGAFFIDSLSPTEAFTQAFDPICRPLSSWGLWSSRVVNVDALSRDGGQLAITKFKAVPGGAVISGRFSFLAQRVDFYTDPSGVLPVRGTFVAPLITDLSPCAS